MTDFAFPVAVLFFAWLFAPLPVHCQKQLAKSQKIQSAKTVYFDNQTGADALGAAALARLKKRGRFQIVDDKKLADLIFCYRLTLTTEATSFFLAVKLARWIPADMSKRTACLITTCKLRFVMRI